MQTPKFRIGERIRLDSFDHPQLNGIYTVLEVRTGGGFDPIGNAYVDTVAYKLDDGPGDHYWAECALRKLHRPPDAMARLISSLQRLGEDLDKEPTIV